MRFKRLVEFLTRPVAGVSHGLAMISGLTVLIITMIVTADVALRYLANRPLLFASETCEFLLCLIVFAALPYTFQRGSHIRIDLITRMLPSKARYRLRTATFGVGLFYIVVLTWQIWLYIKESYMFNRESTVLLFPIWLPQLSMLIGSVVFILVVLLGLLRHLAGGAEPHGK